MAWVLSFTSAAMLWLMGNKSKWGPRVGLLNQVLWLIFAIMIREYGLLPGIALYTIVHVRNIVVWEWNNDHSCFPAQNQHDAK